MHYRERYLPHKVRRRRLSRQHVLGKDESEETGDRLTASAYHSFLPFKMMRMIMRMTVRMMVGMMVATMMVLVSQEFGCMKYFRSDIGDKINNISKHMIHRMPYVLLYIRGNKGPAPLPPIYLSTPARYLLDNVEV